MPTFCKNAASNIKKARFCTTKKICFSNILLKTVLIQIWIRTRIRNFFDVGSGNKYFRIHKTDPHTTYRNNLELALQKSNPPRQVSSPFCPASRQSRNSQIHSTENTVQDIVCLSVYCLLAAKQRSK